MHLHQQHRHRRDRQVGDHGRGGHRQHAGIAEQPLEDRNAHEGDRRKTQQAGLQRRRAQRMAQHTKPDQQHRDIERDQGQRGREQKRGLAPGRIRRGLDDADEHDRRQRKIEHQFIDALDLVLVELAGSPGPIAERDHEQHRQQYGERSDEHEDADGPKDRARGDGAARTGTHTRIAAAHCQGHRWRWHSGTLSSG